MSGEHQIRMVSGEQNSPQVYGEQNSRLVSGEQNNRKVYGEQSRILLFGEQIFSSGCMDMVFRGLWWWLVVVSGGRVAECCLERTRSEWCLKSRTALRCTEVGGEPDSNTGPIADRISDSISDSSSRFQDFKISYGG